MREGIALLQVEGLSVRLNEIDILTDVSLAARHTGVVGIVGPNGAGKTTLFNVITGLVPPSAGSVTFDGQLLRPLRPNQSARLGIARTLQDGGLFDKLSILDNVMAGFAQRSRRQAVGSMFGMPDRREQLMRSQAMGVLDSIGIADDAEKRAAGLTLGQRKRISLAKALVSEPRLLLLDEPAAGISREEVAELSELIQRLSNDMAIIVIEHDFEFIRALCDSVVVLDDGRIVTIGTPAEVRADPTAQRIYFGQPG
jgi:branched-chain amino acid transport system ATP-binding protein